MIPCCSSSGWSGEIAAVALAWQASRKYTADLAYSNPSPVKLLPLRIHDNCIVRPFLIVVVFSLWSSEAADAQKPPTLAEARAFMDRAEAKLLDLTIQSSRADWVKSTYITGDTEMLAAKADEQQIAATMQLAKESTRFNNLKMPDALAREFKLLRLSLTLAAPSDPKES